MEVTMKYTVFLLCKECDNIFLSTNKIVAEKKLVCGQGCGGDLQSIDKTAAHKYFEEKRQNERQV
jgi:hypothetical protein